MLSSKYKIELGYINIYVQDVLFKIEKHIWGLTLPSKIQTEMKRSVQLLLNSSLQTNRTRNERSTQLEALIINHTVQKSHSAFGTTDAHTGRYSLV